MTEDNKRRLDVLHRIQNYNGEWSPIWDPCSAMGYVYDPDIRSSEDNDELMQDLDYLARNDYLEKSFADKLTVCPVCDSHHVNAREVCVSCNSPQIQEIPLIHHFRCGYVGAIDLFERDDKGARRCPKCEGKLEHLGTDHDLPGSNYNCLNCNASFQAPDVEALCLSCQKRSLGVDLLKRDVYMYRISSLGFSALRNGRFFDADKEQIFEENSRIIRHSLFMYLLEGEKDRQKRYGIPYGLLLVQPCDMTDPLRAMKELGSRIAKKLRSSDRLGRLDNEHLLILLTSCDPANVSLAANRLADNNMRVLIVELSPIKSVHEELEIARAKLRNNDRVS